MHNIKIIKLKNTEITTVNLHFEKRIYIDSCLDGRILK